MALKKLRKKIKGNLHVFNLAVNNEIAVDKYLIDKLNKINTKQVTFIPIRPMKSLPKIQSLKIGKQIYLLLAICFLILSPFYFLIQLLKNISFAISNGSIIAIKNKLILNVGVNNLHLLKKINEIEVQSLIIKPSHNKQYNNIASTLTAKHFFLAYLYSVIGIIYFSIKTKDYRHIIQAYLAFDFFLVMFALMDLKHNMETVYFSNHYDRWAVLIDNILFDKKLIQIQHGVLPESINLPYKLKNIKKVYTFNKSNQERFIKYVLDSTSKAVFKTMDVSLDLESVKHNKKTILIIGQPHSIERELQIINKINNNFIIYIKPHPGFSSDPYTDIKNTILIKERHFYPKVDLVLNYESTLGIEYEASNIDVIWWKDMGIEELVLIINKTLNYEN